jgi:chemotaxis protein MotB
MNVRFIVKGIALAVAGLMLGGCVSQAKYDMAVRQRDDYRRQVDALTRTENVLRGDLQARRSEMDELNETHAHLRSSLATYIAAKQIKLQAMESGVIVLMQEDVLFATGSSDLNESGEVVLAEISKELKEIPFQVVVAGHTDNVPIGPSLAKRYPSNWDLAAARASRVARLIESKGVDKKRLAVVSFGSNDPVTSNDTPEGRAQNRRIEIRLRPVIPGA